MSNPIPGSGFRTTRWTRVLEARGSLESSKVALAELCEAYYEPVHAFLRATVRDGSARDLTHAFFAKLLEGDGLARLERKGDGKFRSYLLGAVKHFLADESKRKASEKRGGGREPVSFEAAEGNEVGPSTQAEVRKADATEPPDDAFFDRHWAYAVLGRALKQLEESVENREQFEVLKPWLGGNRSGALSQADAAARLEMSEGAVKVAIHRLRQRLRALVKAEVAQTVEAGNGGEISIELDYLIRALG